MRYIDKSDFVYSRKGESISNEFIDKQWINGRYTNLKYKYLGHYKKELDSLIFSEQNGFCCYCMRELTPKNITLEHVIPNSLNDQVEFDKYINTGFISNNIYLWDGNVNNKILPPPYPHFVAYENLVGSCNGELDNKYECCNNKRQINQIIPLFFMKNISERVGYAKDGALDFDDNDITLKETLDVLCLNHSSLQMFRRMWYVISSQYNIMDVLDAVDDKDLRTEMLFLKGVQAEARKTFNNIHYWILFFQFYWFYYYYRNKP